MEITFQTSAHGDYRIPGDWGAQTCNMPQWKLLQNARRNSFLNVGWVKRQNAINGDLLIVAGGPSLRDQLDNIRARIFMGQVVWAMNGAHDFLLDNNIIPDAMVMMDGKPECTRYVKKPHVDVEYLIASRCDPDVFKALEGFGITLWHAYDEGIEKALQEFDREWFAVGGGSTVSLHALQLGFCMGFRTFHVFGMDSSYTDAEHAYEDMPSPEQSPERLNVRVNGRSFDCAPWMLKQVDNFKTVSRVLMERGCSIRIHGDGLLGDAVTGEGG